MKTEKRPSGLKVLIGDKKFYTLVLGIAVPMMIQNGITNFVSLLDNIMVGQLGTEQMSGVAIVNQLTFVFSLCLFGAVSGVGIFGAQYYGRRDWEGMRNSFRLKFIICTTISVLAVVIFIFAGDNLIDYYLQGEGAEGDIAATFTHGRHYLTIMLWGLAPQAFSQIYASMQREMGDTKIPMIAGVAAVFTNLSLNWILIFGHLGFPELGVEGAALATVISRYVEMLIVIIWTHCHKEKYVYIKGAYRSFHVPGSLVKQVMIKGLPLLINETLWSAGMAMLTQCYSTRGLEVVAAYNIASTITNLFNVVYLSLGFSVGIVIGPMLGAGDMEEARITAYRMIAFSFMMALLVGALVFAIAPLFPKLYNTTQDVRDLAAGIIRVGACFSPAYAFENASYFTLRAGGKTGITFLFDSAFMCVISVPVAYVLSRFTGLAILPLYACVNMLNLLKCLLGFVLVKKGVWINNIVNEIS
ncbi:MAG: MATE family efflux transporter [Lachnospiraceae bacterium]|nr:MATE family efflux transporter [Lachnospiraceae bacterium]